MNLATRLASATLGLVAATGLMLFPASTASADVSAGSGQTVGARTFCDATTHTLYYRTDRATTDDTIVQRRVWLYTAKSGCFVWRDWEYANDTTIRTTIPAAAGQTAWTYTEFASFKMWAPALVTRRAEYGRFYQWTGSRYVGTSGGCRL